MPVLELKFPAGRFHATPWGRHVNEGAVEWPPSPWRVLRALIATWYLKAQEEVSQQAMQSLVLALAQNPPSYRVPPAAFGHTRHYMPYNDGKKAKTTKVFDTFVHLAPDDPLLIFWRGDLMEDPLRALDILLSRMGYFGRAESLVEARLIKDANGYTPNVTLMNGEGKIYQEQELVRLLAPMPNEQYLAWKQQYTSSASPPSEPARGKKRTSRKTEPVLPEDVSAALLADTGQLQAAGWALPPGSITLNYLRPARCFDVAPIPTRKRRPPAPTVACFAVASQVMPRLIHTISVTDRMHKSLLAHFPDGAPAIFSGRDANGKPLLGNRHAYVLCERHEKRDAISHVLVCLRQRSDSSGFDDAARLAFQRIRKLWGHGGHDLQLVLLGLGQPADFPDLQVLNRSSVWQSLTPFVSTRHAKFYRDGRPKLDAEGWHIGSPAHDLRRLIAEAGIPLPTKMETLQRAGIGERSLQWLQFKTERHNGSGKRAHQPPCGFRLTFPHEIPGPLAFGYAAHFGLGVFVPA